MWEVGQGEKGRSSPALCLLGADPSLGSHRPSSIVVWVPDFHLGQGEPPSPRPPTPSMAPLLVLLSSPQPQHRASSQEARLCPESVNKYEV